MTVAEYIVRFLAARGVRHVFEMSGGMITPLLDAADGHVDLVSCPHEQIAGFAADGMARMTGKPGAAFATSGPGATNLLTAIADCYFDSVPAVFITGQVPTTELRRDRPVRQLGFQETDIVAMAKPITVWTEQVPSAINVRAALQMAFFCATGGRPGPALLDIPFNVLRAHIADTAIPEPIPPTPQVVEVDRAVEAIKAAKRPLMLVGGGVRASGAIDGVRKLVKSLWIPVVNSLLGVDVLGYEHPMRHGMIGTYGNRWANWAVMQSDLLLVLGSRLDVRQTGSLAGAFANRQIIAVDIDCEAGQRVPGVHVVRADLHDFCDSMLAKIGDGCNALRLDLREWFANVGVQRLNWPAETEQAVEGINPNVFMRELGRASDRAAALVVDVGANQMWAAQSLVTHSGQRFMTSGGHGAMGFALPAAIGVALASKSPVVAIMGDGGFQVNSPALHTIARLGLPVKIVVLNNRGHAMVRGQQDQLFGGRHVSTAVAGPSVGAIASAHMILDLRIGETEDVRDALAWLWEAPGPRLLDVAIDPKAAPLPKVPFGRRLDDMEPHR